MKASLDGMTVIFVFSFFIGDWNSNLKYNTIIKSLGLLDYNGHCEEYLYIGMTWRVTNTYNPEG